MAKAIKSINIARVVAEWYDVPIATDNGILGHRRWKTLVNARHMMMWLMKEMCQSSTPEIGSALNRDHSTVIQGIKRIDKLIKEDPEWASDALELIQIIREESRKKL